MVEEKIITLNLKRYVSKKPFWKRKVYAARFVKEVLKKMAKAETLAVSNKLNEKIWKDSATTLKVKLIKNDKIVKAELVE